MENIIIKRKRYQIDDVLAKDDFHESYKASLNGKTYFIRKYINKDEYIASLGQSKSLKKLGITIPKILKKDKDVFAIVYQYINGETIAEHLAKEDLPDEYFTYIFNMYRFARFSKFEINYLPENFKLEGKNLYYLSLEKSEQNPEKNLENYGLNYWIISKEGYDHLIELGFEVDKKRILSKGDANKKIVLLSIMKW